MKIKVIAFVAILGLPCILRAGDPDQPRERGERRERGTASLPDRNAKALTDENDPHFALEEKGCPEGRIQDYLRRHGDHGVIDPFVLLELNRDTYRMMESEKRLRALSGIGGSTWAALGPTNGAGRMTAVAPHPMTAGTALAGAAGGGVWKTTDSGATWTVLTDSLANLSVGAVVYAPSNPQIVYVGTGEGGYAIDFIPGFGLLQSPDGGTTWNLPMSVVASMFYRISVNPGDANDLVIGTNNGAQRSTMGQNGPWTQVINRDSAGVTKGYGDVTDIVRDPTNAQILYAATWDRNNWCARYACFDPSIFQSPTILKSTNGGAAWASTAMTGFPVSDVNNRVNRIGLAIAPSNTQILYAATSIYNAISGIETSHVYKSTDGGVSWSDTTLSSNASTSISRYLGTQAWYDNTIVVSPSDANVVIAGGVNSVKTIDGGTTWTTPPFSPCCVHVDWHDLRYDPAGTLYVANDGGIWTSPDSGSTSVDRNTNLATRQFYGISPDPVSPNRIFGGQQDNGTIDRDAVGTIWNFFTGGDGFQSAVNPSDPSVVYSTSQFGWIYRGKKGTNRSPSPLSLQVPFDPTEYAPFLSLITLDATNPGTVYLASSRLWRSLTGGDGWAPLPTTTTDGSTWQPTYIITAMAVSKSNPQIIMVAKYNDVFRSTDGGTSWTHVVSGLPGRDVNGLEIHPTDPNTVFAALAGTSGTSVYYTTNGGTSWSARGTGLPSYSALVVRFDPIDPTTLYCGTDVGVYRSTDSGATWSRFGTGLPAVSVYDVKAVGDGASLRAATHGRGVWELTVTGTTNHPPTATITTPASTPQTLAKGGSLTFQGTFTDPDADPVSATWFFPDTWTSVPATSGVSITHTFYRAGRWPVSLAVTDSHGAKGAASVDVIVTEAGESCATPIVVPGSGPFPYTVTVTTEESTRELSDPSPVGICYPYQAYNGIWLSFTPAASGTYTISACGSKVSAVVAGFAGNACGPYTSIGLCLANYGPIADCSADTTASLALTAGTTYRLLVSNYFSQDYGPVSFTITNGSLSSTTPVISSVSPAIGSSSGGTPVVITGSGFQAGATVSLGGVGATNVTVVSSAVITATTGAHAAGAVDAAVTSGGTGTLQSAYTYVTPSVTAPTSVLATATSTSVVHVTWSAVPGADHYNVYRRTGVSFGLAGTVMAPTTFLDDSGRTANTAYLYKVVAVGSGGDVSPDSNIDLAVTTIFTDDPITVATTQVKALHLIEMRAAVNAIETLAGITPTVFTDAVPTGVAVKAIHITELRTALTNARNSLSLSPLSFTNTLVAGTSIVQAIDFTEIRNGMK